MRALVSCSALILASLVGCSGGKKPAPLNGSEWGSTCLSTICTLVQYWNVDGYQGYCRYQNQQNTIIPFTNSDVGTILCDDCPGYSTTAVFRYYCAQSDADVTTLRQMTRATCPTDSDFDPSTPFPSGLLSPQLIIYMPFSNTAMYLPTVGWFDVRKIAGFAGYRLTATARSFGRISGSGACTASAEFLGQRAPSSTIVNVDPARSYAFVADQAGNSAIAPVSGIVALRTDCLGSCPLHFDTFEVSLEDFVLGGTAFDGTRVLSHGLFDAPRGGNGLYSISPSVRFDISSVVAGQLIGLGRIGPDSPGAAAFDGHNFGAQFAMETSGLIIALVVVGNAPNAPPKALARVPATVECSVPGGANVLLDGSGSTDLDGDIVSYRWTRDDGIVLAEGPEPRTSVFLGLGKHRVTLRVADDAGQSDSQSVDVEVRDTTPPVITVEGTPVCIWPPNHEYALVDAADLGTLVQDACDPAPKVVVMSVESNQPDDALGDGHTYDDVIAGSGAFCVRAERSGVSIGPRVYSVELTAIDASCNATNAAALTFVVPHDLSSATCGDATVLRAKGVGGDAQECSAGVEPPSCAGAGASTTAIGQSCGTGGIGGLTFLGPLLAWRRRKRVAWTLCVFAVGASSCTRSAQNSTCPIGWWRGTSQVCTVACMASPAPPECAQADCETFSIVGFEGAASGGTQWSGVAVASRAANTFTLFGPLQESAFTSDGTTLTVGDQTRPLDCSGDTMSCGNATYSAACSAFAASLRKAAVEGATSGTGAGCR